MTSMQPSHACRMSSVRSHTIQVRWADAHPTFKFQLKLFVWLLYIPKSPSSVPHKILTCWDLVIFVIFINPMGWNLVFFWIQNWKKLVKFGIFLDPELVKFGIFLDPELVKFGIFLDPELEKFGIFLIFFGFRKFDKIWNFLKFWKFLYNLIFDSFMQ